MYASKYVLTDPQDVADVKDQVQKLWPGAARGRNPVPLPIPLVESNMKQLSQGFSVTHKADGTRFILVLGKYSKQSFTRSLFYSVLIDRTFCIYVVRVAADLRFYDGSIFDGELVMQHEAQLESPRQTFLVFDAVAICGKTIVQSDFVTRYQVVAKVFPVGTVDFYIQEDPSTWTSNAVKAAQSGAIVSLGNDACLRFQAKTFMRAANVQLLLSHKPKFATDGLVFIREADPVGIGRCASLLKWKQHHTVDLLIVARPGASPVFGHWQLTVGYASGKEIKQIGPSGLRLSNGRYQPLALLPNEFLLSLLQSRTETFSTILECIVQVDADIINIEPVRIRLDKRSPNSLQVLIFTVEQAFVPLADLVQACLS